MTEIDELKKLSPSERIARLKELEEKRKNEIEEAEALIKESEREITIEDELRKIPIPHAKFFDVSELGMVSPEGKRAAKHARFMGDEKVDVAAEATRAGRLGKLEESVEKEAEDRGITSESAKATRGVSYGGALEDAMSMAYDVAGKKFYDSTNQLGEKVRSGEASQEEIYRFEKAGEQIREAHSHADYIHDHEARERIDNMYSRMHDIEEQMKERRRAYGI